MPLRSGGQYKEEAPPDGVESGVDRQKAKRDKFNRQGAKREERYRRGRRGQKSTAKGRRDRSSLERYRRCRRRGRGSSIKSGGTAWKPSQGPGKCKGGRSRCMDQAAGAAGGHGRLAYVPIEPDRTAAGKRSRSETKETAMMRKSLYTLVPKTAKDMSAMLEDVDMAGRWQWSIQSHIQNFLPQHHRRLPRRLQRLLWRKHCRGKC